ncbi:MAG TPA: hypothetical protein VM183_01200 [Burkholderiales bacterium]|nr:hypothetical protein [Burkholderiales bacterium]
MANILTAVAPDTAERVRRILHGHNLHFVHHIDEAQNALDNEGIQLVFVGARFDESRMFDLLDFIRLDAERKKIPIVAAIVGTTRMAKETITGLAHTTKIFGASVFLNLNDFTDDETANGRLRIIVDALIAPPDVIPTLRKTLSDPDGPRGR